MATGGSTIDGVSIGLVDFATGNTVRAGYEFAPSGGGFLGRQTVDVDARYYMRLATNGVFALREGPWKFTPVRGSGGFSFPKNLKPAPGEATSQLYHLADDPAETRNLALERKDIAARMEKRLTEIQSGERTR